MALKRGPQLSQIDRAAGVEDEPGAVKQRPPDLEGRGVERERRHLQEDLIRPELSVRLSTDEPDDVAVGDDDALRLAGRARRVHDVGLVGGGDRGLDGLIALRQDRRVREQLGVEDERDLRVADDELAPLRRIARVEGHVSAATLEDSEQPHHHLERALRRDAHSRALDDAAGTKVAGELVRAAVELAVGDRLAVHRHCARVWLPLRDRREDVVDRRVPRVAGGRVVPLDQQTVALRLREQRKG